MRAVPTLLLAVAFVPFALGARAVRAQTPVQPASTAAPSRASAAASAVMQTAAARRTGPIRIDGDLRDAAWAAAPVTSDFRQSWPNAGAPATERTEVRVLYDDDAIYVGVRAFDDRPDSIAAPLARRDATGIYSDWIYVMIDSYHDRRTGFRFTVNPAGVQKDVFHSNDTNEDLNWDAVWESATAIDSLGWTAEMRIPLSQLRFGPADASGNRTWGFQVQRDVARKNERDTWSPWTRESGGFVSQFGDLTGLAGLTPPRQLEVLPYVRTRVTRAPGDTASPFYRLTKNEPAAGADVKAGLPGGLTLTATINPDFGQVEVDPAVVNLSAFETFFPEKRPFFLERSDVFSFGDLSVNNDYGGQNFFYSRRIGRAPQGYVNAPDARYVDAPDESKILGAAKVTGKRGPWTIGVLDAVTSHVDAKYAPDAVTPAKTAPVEPASNALVARVKREFNDGATVIGALATQLDRAMGSTSDSTLRDIMRERATLAGLDFEHSWARRAWILGGYAVATNVAGDSIALAATQRSSARYFQRPDQHYVAYDPTRTSLGGHMEEVAIAHRGQVFGSLAVKDVSPGVELNDLGYMTRADYRSVATDLAYQDNTPGTHLRNWNVFGYTTHAWNYGGISTYQQGGVGADATLNNLWDFGGNAFVSPRYFSDRLTRGGPMAMLPVQWGMHTFLDTDTRRIVAGSASLALQGDRAGSIADNEEIDLILRPSSSVRITTGPSLMHSTYTAQYVTTVADANATATYGARYVFADVNQRVLGLDTRVDWTFSPKLSLQLYAQPFVASGKYTNYKEFSKPSGYDFAVYGKDRGTISSQRFPPYTQYTVDPDGAGPAQPFSFWDQSFRLRSLRGNAVLRWEYRPGSALFFVWQQQRAGLDYTGDFAPRSDVPDIFHTVPTNVFMVKATWWIGL